MVHAAGYAAASGCTVDSTTFIFTCPPTTSNGLTLLRTFEFFDSTGAPMLAFNGVNTASVAVMATESGVRPTANGADTVSGTRSLTATGCWATTRRGFGTARAPASSAATGRTASRRAPPTFPTTPRSRTSSWTSPLQQSVPASGTITRLVSGTGTVTRNGTTKSITISRTVTITFNGTEFVPMTVGTVAYTLDLATGQATKNSRERGPHR